MTEQERLDAMMEMLRLLWPKGYGSFPFKLGEAPSRVFYQSRGEEGDPVVYGIVYKGSIMHWNEGVEEVSILPKGKRRLVNGWFIDRLYSSTGYAGDPESEFEWADEEFVRGEPSAAVAFTTMALSDKMYDRLHEMGFV